MCGRNNKRGGESTGANRYLWPVQVDKYSKKGMEGGVWEELMTERN
jgi:hypothetical protein